METRRFKLKGHHGGRRERGKGAAGGATTTGARAVVGEVADSAAVRRPRLLHAHLEVQTRPSLGPASESRSPCAELCSLHREWSAESLISREVIPEESAHLHGMAATSRSSQLSNEVCQPAFTARDSGSQSPAPGMAGNSNVTSAGTQGGGHTTQTRKKLPQGRPSSRDDLPGLPPLKSYGTKKSSAGYRHDDAVCALSSSPLAHICMYIHTYIHVHKCSRHRSWHTYMYINARDTGPGTPLRRRALPYDRSLLHMIGLF